MICIYEKTETSFTYNGLGTLEPLECFFSSEINGVWQLEMYVPYDPEGKSKLIANDRILKVTDIDCIQEQTSDYQLFRIYDYRKEGSNIYVLAYPIGLDARFDTYTNSLQCNYKTAAQAISQINNVSNKYTVSTDITSSTLKSAQWSHSNIISMLNTDEEGFVQKWGGEICYDNYNIKVNNSLGRSSGASEVRYGKNIRGMSFEEDISNVITRLYPIANSGEVLNGVSAYKIANNQYVDASNASDYPIPHINYVEAPYNLVQMSNDGSANYTASYAAYETIRDATANWLNDALLGENTGGVDGLLLSMELGWLVDNYALTMANDGTQGLVEYITDNIANDSNNPILSSAVKSLIYSAIKAGFDLVLKDDTSAVYVGASSKKMWDAPQSQRFYSYTWDSAGNYRVNKNGDAEYAWVYASSKWQQLDDEGITTGTVDSANWKWYKVTGKKYKRYGNKKKKRFLNDQWWKINDIWYWFDGNGEGDYGASLQANCYDMVDSMLVSSKTIHALLSPICKNAESQLFFLLYNQMTDYCTNLFVTEKMSYPTPSISIDMVDLSRTEEYKNYSNLLKIKLGDTIKCLNSKLNIVTDLRVTSLTYDVLRKYNSAIQIGMTENSIISAFDKYGRISDETLAKQGLIAGNGIMIQGNVISAVGQKITDVFVNGHSVTYGGKAYIDLDEIGGEGLQWFEETEDALFGYSTQMALIDDSNYKTATAGNSIEISSSDNIWKSIITVSGGDSTLMFYYPYQYGTKASKIVDEINQGNDGNIMVLSKSNFSVNVVSSPVPPDYPSPAVFTDFSTASMTDGWQPAYDEHGTLYSGPIAFHGSTQVNGETWYTAVIGYNSRYNCSDTRTLLDYLTVAQYPSGNVSYDAAYETVADLIQATVSLTKSITGGNFNGISREGNLAFFAGADDEHGTNAPIKIYTDGTYEGIGGQVDDVKVDNNSVVTNRVANINTMTGATSQANGSKGLVPAPLIANKDQFLKGDGTWSVPNDYDGTNHGLVPAPASGDSGYLKVDGTWDEPEGTTVVANPSGTATDSLTSLQVGEDIYSISGATEIKTEIVSTQHFSQWVKKYTSGSVTDISFAIGTYTDYEITLECFDGDYSTYDLHEEVVYAVPIPATVKKINYQIETLYKECSLTTDDWYPMIGLKTTLDTSNYCQPSDTDWVAKQKFNNQNQVYTGTLEFTSSVPTYLYFISNSWGVHIRSLELVEYSGGSGASELNDLDDVTVSSPTNGQILTYNSSNQVWENTTPSSGGGGIDYSTSEQNTGLKWIDGRPIYQKTFTLGTVAQGVSLISSNFKATTYDEVWQTDIHWRYNTINLDVGNHGGTGGAIYVELYDNTGLYVVNLSGVDATNFYVTLRYTKITD